MVCYWISDQTIEEKIMSKDGVNSNDEYGVAASLLEIARAHEAANPKTGTAAAFTVANTEPTLADRTNAALRENGASSDLKDGKLVPSTLSW
jgi:hypothetical protein